MPPAATAIAAPGPAPSSKEVWLISAGHALTHWYPATFYLLLPLIGKELGLSYTQIGFMMSVQHLVGAISNVPGGIFVDTVGRKGYLMALSLFWVGFPYALMSLTHSYWMLVACIVLVGIGNNLWHPTAIPTLAHRFPERKALVLSFHGMGGNVGDACAPLVVGALLAVMSWRSAVVANVIPGLIASVLILVSLRSIDYGARKKEPGGSAAANYLADLKTLLKNRPVLLISTTGFFRTGTQSALLTFLPVYLAYELGYNPFWVGAAMFAMQVAGFVSAPIVGYFSDRVGRRSLMMGSMAATGAVLLSMAFAGKSLLFIVLIAMLGFFMYATRPVIQAWALEMTPKRMAGTTVGLLFSTQAAGAGVAPLLGGIIADRYGLFAAFYFLAATIIVANLFVFLIPKDAEKTAAT